MYVCLLLVSSIKFVGVVFDEKLMEISYCYANNMFKKMFL